MKNRESLAGESAGQAWAQYCRPDGPRRLTARPQCHKPREFKHLKSVAALCALAPECVAWYRVFGQPQNPAQSVPREDHSKTPAPKRHARPGAEPNQNLTEKCQARTSHAAHTEGRQNYKRPRQPYSEPKMQYRANIVSPPILHHFARIGDTGKARGLRDKRRPAPEAQSRKIRPKPRIPDESVERTLLRPQIHTRTAKPRLTSPNHSAKLAMMWRNFLKVKSTRRESTKRAEIIWP